MLTVAGVSFIFISKHEESVLQAFPWTGLSQVYVPNVMSSLSFSPCSRFVSGCLCSVYSTVVIDLRRWRTQLRGLLCCIFVVLIPCDQAWNLWMWKLFGVTAFDRFWWQVLGVEGELKCERRGSITTRTLLDVWCLKLLGTAWTSRVLCWVLNILRCLYEFVFRN